MNTKIPEFNSRAEFERWFADGNPASVERDAAGHYKLIQASNAWMAWQCAVIAAAQYVSAAYLDIGNEISAELHGNFDAANFSKLTGARDALVAVADGLRGGVEWTS